MHQPDYGDVRTGEIFLPWTRFHAVKDYFDMGALVAEAPGLRVTINVVPSLIDQLLAYSSGTARETYTALTLRDAGDLEEAERSFLLRVFFQLPWSSMVFPYPRYKELLQRRGAQDERGDYREGLKRYSPRDYRDLQTWFNLAWCGRALRQEPEIASLFRKGKDFSEDDKRRLIDLQHAFIGRILPSYRRLTEEHGLEVSVSPYYHPILPLLCDTRSAREALPGLPLPRQMFSFPSDAVEQIRRAQQRCFEIFGRHPEGMWPSEGSVSDAMAALARQAGLRWLASDEGVLLNSLARESRASAPLSPAQRYSAYQWGDDPSGPCVFFRDHRLSDLIGFTYSRWDPRSAADDFLRRLRQIHEALPDDGRHYVVPVILDGENAWEHYPDNGTVFLTLLYHALTEPEWLRTVTLSGFLDLEAHRKPLASMVAGSWIDGSFSTWIGHPEKNRAWEFLAAARQFLDLSRKEGCDEKAFSAALQEMMIAEGSDWFWWYGDDHPTENAAEFDALFRSHVRNIYRLMGRLHAPELDTPIKQAKVRTRYRPPRHTITPLLDGLVTDYFEWLAAGFAFPDAGESMHRTQRYIEKVLFGYDARQFYVRIDLEGDQAAAFPAGIALQLEFVSPADCRLSLERSEGCRWRCRTIRSSKPGLAPGFAAGKILELGIPLDALGVTKPDQVRFCITVFEEDNELERFPASGYLEVPVDASGLDRQEWVV